MSFNTQVVQNFAPFLVSIYYMQIPGAASKFKVLDSSRCYMSS
jgi:hypothetical protein